jgi:hypothetical protein
MNPEPLLRINLFEPLQVQLGDRPPLNEHYLRHKAKALFVHLFLNRGRWLSKYELLVAFVRGAMLGLLFLFGGGLPPGKYPLVCPIRGHEQRGMGATLRVVGP